MKHSSPDSSTEVDGKVDPQSAGSGVGGVRRGDEGVIGTKDCRGHPLAPGAGCMNRPEEGPGGLFHVEHWLVVTPLVGIELADSASQNRAGPGHRTRRK